MDNHSDDQRKYDVESGSEYSPGENDRKVNFVEPSYDTPKSIHRPTEAFRTSNKLSVLGEKTKSLEDVIEEGIHYREVLVLLFLCGLITGVFNGCILWTNKLLSIAQSRLLVVNNVGPLYYMITATTSCAISAYIIKRGKLKATTGSGMPEVKSLMVNDFKAIEFPRIVSPKILVLRATSLLFAASSGLSVGLQGPLVHCSVCTAYTLAQYLPRFTGMVDNPSIMRQVFAAAAAVGLATVFNAPVGGLLFSVEVTSTYYLISNYWRSFMAATTGAVMYSVFLINRTQTARIFEVDYVQDPFHKWELPIFALMSFTIGVMALLFLRCHQTWIVLTRRVIKAFPVSTAAAAGAFTALMVYAIRAHSNNGLSVAVIVHDSFKDANISELHTYVGVSRIVGLFISLVVRIVLTIIGTTLNISCGLFMPMLTIGSLAGRVFGQIIANTVRESAHIYVAGYAMVGAAAFVSGTTHTISCAVIVIEMTGQINMLLPCLLGAVIACGITKSRTLSLYDQGMVNKGLDSFELLLLTSDGFGDVMDSGVISVTRTCQIADLFLMLEGGQQRVFPIVETIEQGKLVGSIARRDIFLYLKHLFKKEGLETYLRETLQADCMYDDGAVERVALKTKVSIKNARFRLIRAASQKLRNLNLDTLRQMVNLSGRATPPPAEPAPTAVELSPMARHRIGVNGVTSLTAADAARVEALLEREITLSEDGHLHTNTFPFTVPEHATMDQLYVLFEMVKVQNVFVLTDKGKLKGMINKESLLANLRSKVK